MATFTVVALCRHCHRAYRLREPGSEPPEEWRGSAEQWQDVCNEQQDFCPCQSKQIQKQQEPPTPQQLEMF